MRSTMVVLLAGLALAGCGDAEGPPSYSRVAASVTVEASSTGVVSSLGDTRTFTATVKDASQSVIVSPELIWSTNRPDLVSIAPSGASVTVTAIGNGDALLTATSGTVQATVGVSIRQRIASVVVTSPVSALVFGTPVQLFARAIDAREHAIAEVTAFTFASSDPDIATVSPEGVVIGLPGFADPNVTISASVTQGGVTYTGSVPLTVGPPPQSTFDHIAVATANVVPVRVTTPGVGVGYFASMGSVIHYSVTWSKLTGPAMEIHLHGPSTDEQLGDILVDLSPVDQSASSGTMSGYFEAANIRGQHGEPPISLDSLRTLMNTRQVYLDVHTTAHRGGELRGRVEVTFGL
jgi:hypothetical protein